MLLLGAHTSSKGSTLAHALSTSSALRYRSRLLARRAAPRTRLQLQRGAACGGVLLRVLLAALAPAVARAVVPATGCLAATGTVGAVAAMGGCSVTMTMFDTYTATTPLTIGVNLGHHHPNDGTWVAFLEHLGVNGARNFGMGGLGALLQQGAPQRVAR